MSDFAKIKDQLKDKLTKAQTTKEVDIIRAEIFSKNGLINSEFKKLSSLSPEYKKKAATEINNAKEELSKIFLDKADKLNESEIDELIKKEILNHYGYKELMLV